MKKKLSLLLVMVMALTMVLGTGVCAWADAPVAGCPDATWSSYDHFHPNDTTFTLGTGGDSATCYGGYYYKKCEDGAVERIEIGENNQSIVMCRSTSYAFPEGTLVYTFSSGPTDPISAANWYYVNQGTKQFVWCYNNHQDITYPHPAAPTKRIEGAEFAEVAAPAYVPHVHNFVYGVITEPTENADGLEGEICTGCGAVRNTQPISAYSYTLEKYALEKINASKPGQTITFEFGELNSFPKSFMEKLVEKSSAGVTFVFKYMVNHELQTITIPAGTPINLDFDWYGYAKMAELYGEN